ncbi:MAG TPA: hypothetical protein VGW12_14450 [Pyrinomonadaceae bacterium]|nr:hypothetical protein [Pyrinomonadaceae bacterium]
MHHWRSRLLAFLIGFGIGLVLFLVVSFGLGLLRSSRQTSTRREATGPQRCSAADGFSSPEEILAALKSEDVLVRREVFRRLFLRPGVATTYYDYERDRDYPERAGHATVTYVNLDEQSPAEAVLTFNRRENPVALVLKREACGWRLVDALGAWLRFEDYPYHGWLEMPETVKRGVHEILLRESTGDATHYARNVRLLKLLDGALVQVAEFSEESIKPAEHYKGADWSDVKQRDVTRCVFLTRSDAEKPKLRLETQAEIVKYSGSPPSNTYWLETDGAWHMARRHWRTRDTTRLRLLNKHTHELVWDEGRKRFIAER